MEDNEITNEALNDLEKIFKDYIVDKVQESITSDLKDFREVLMEDNHYIKKAIKSLGSSITNQINIYNNSKEEILMSFDELIKKTDKSNDSITKYVTELETKIENVKEKSEETSNLIVRNLKINRVINISSFILILIGIIADIIFNMLK